MRMHWLTIPAAAAVAAVTLPGAARAAEPVQFKVCPSQEKVEQILQSNGSFVPDDCRTVTVTRVESPAGPICVLDSGKDNPGVLGTIRDAITTTQWWTACANLRAP